MKRSAINPVSKKRQALNLERREMVKQILHDRPNCEAGLEHCSGRSVDVHEVLNRSQGGPIVGGAESDYRALCRDCHTYITENPKFSYEMGFSKHSWD
jgi:hypothetical protein